MKTRKVSIGYQRIANICRNLFIRVPSPSLSLGQGRGAGQCQNYNNLPVASKVFLDNSPAIKHEPSTLARSDHPAYNRRDRLSLYKGGKGGYAGEKVAF